MKIPIVLLNALFCATAFHCCFGQQLEMPNGARVNCRLEQTISAVAEEGQEVRLSVTEDVKVNDFVVIPRGSPVVGTIMQSWANRGMGRPGKLDFSIDKVKAADGEYIPLRYTRNKREGGSDGVSTGVIAAGAAVLFWPSAPFLLVRQGKEVTINKGVVLGMFTDRDHVMNTAPAAQPQTGLTASESAAGQAAVSITSNITGADIEIDGNYVGSTPTTRPLDGGLHKIAVKSGSRVWERILQVQGGGAINVNANLDKK